MNTDFLQKELDDLSEQGLYRSLRCVDGQQGPTLLLNGREVINFSSNNYLGLANHPLLCAAAKQAIDRYGCGSAASRLISGNMTLHEELEAKLARFKSTEAALVFNSGFQANIGILSTLTGAGDVIVFVPRSALLSRLAVGQRHRLTILIRPVKTTALPINDIELIDLRP